MGGNKAPETRQSLNPLIWKHAQDTRQKQISQDNEVEARGAFDLAFHSRYQHTSGRQ